MDDLLLDVRDLSISYRGTPALTGFSLQLRRGESAGIVGASGAGKTTLARAILRSLPPHASMTGRLEYRGRCVSAVFQEPSGALHPMLRCGTQVVEVVRARLGLRGEQCRSRARDLFDRVGLDAKAHFAAYPHQLSGGQRQRVLIAQAIAGDPDLVIADEPTASLDAASEAGVLDLLRRLVREGGAALLFITHRPALLRDIAERIVAVDARRAARHGS